MKTHPEQSTLKAFVANELGDIGQLESIRAHIAECEFCREFCDDYRADLEAQTETAKVQPEQRDWTVADEIFSDVYAGRTISLNLLPAPRSISQMYLAADGERPADMVTNLATLFSEQPELVLRVMRDDARGIDYLQLISADPQLAAQAMIQIPEIQKQYVTDDTGKVLLARDELRDPESLQWEIKLPDARFTLRPLVYDPEHVESSREVILETEHHDRIQVVFETKTEGKQILIRVLEIEGEPNFGTIRVSIKQQNIHQVKEVAPNQNVSFNINDSDQEISIRLFR